MPIRIPVPTSGLWSVIAGIINTNFLSLFDNLISNVVNINGPDDWPQDGVSINLDPNTQYNWAPHTVSKPFIIAPGSSFVGAGAVNGSLVYDGVGTMFTSASASWSAFNGIFSCPSGTMFDSTDSIINLLINQMVGVLNMGNIDGGALIITSSSIGDNTGQGFTLENSPVLSVFKCNHEMTSSSAIGINLGTAVLSRMDLYNYQPSGPAGSIGISGVGSANILTGVNARFQGSFQTPGDLAPLSGFDEQEPGFEFFSNGFTVATSRNKFNFYLSGTLPTIIVVNGAVDTWLPLWPLSVGATITTKFDERFSIDNATGIATYIGDPPIEIDVEAPVTVGKAGGGGAELISQGIAKNWDGISQIDIPEGDSVSATDTNAQNPTISVSDISLVKGDTIQMAYMINGNFNIEIHKLTCRGGGI